MNALTWWRVYVRRKKPPRDPDAAKRAREKAFGEITPETRAEDNQRLADAAAGKADRLI